jgi:hypothetical protein
MMTNDKIGIMNLTFKPDFIAAPLVLCSDSVLLLPCKHDVASKTSQVRRGRRPPAAGAIIPIGSEK